MNINSLLADCIVVLHFGYVSFVVVGLLAICVGSVRGWFWVRNVWFRYIHLVCILIVVAEALVGITCPLTTLENHFRRAAGQSVSEASFVGQWVHEALYFEAPQWMFTLAYVIFGFAVVLAMWLSPPSVRNASRR
jgi:hypothetical protein